MRILWITNTIFPEPSIALDIPVPVVGGWMFGLAEQLATRKEITLAVATVYQGSDLKCLNLNGIIYYLLPKKISLGYQKHLEPLWENICSEFLPDIIHIHGTEYNHGLSCMRACETLKFVVSIQGLVGIYARYYYAGLSIIDMLKNITLRDVLRHDTIFDGKKRFIKRGIFEKEYITNSKHIIGRTETGLLYRFEEIEILVENIRKVFCDSSLAQYLSEEGIKIAEYRHSQILNCERTLEIYKSIFS